MSDASSKTINVSSDLSLPQGEYEFLVSTYIQNKSGSSVQSSIDVLSDVTGRFTIFSVTNQTSYTVKSEQTSVIPFNSSVTFYVISADAVVIKILAYRRLS